MKYIKRIAFWFAMLIIALILASAVLMIVWSPGKMEPYRDAAGNVLPDSVSEIVRVPIGGIEQGMIIQGRDIHQPVLLFLHGGPGSPEYPMADAVSGKLADVFTVCWWDQRGSGMSYHSSIPPETMTLEQLVEDTKEVAEYLMDRFGVEKVYLMGHSWGSYLGVYAAAKYPNLFHAYIGIGQVANQFISEQKAYDYMLEQARATGDAKLEKELLKYTLDTPSALVPAYMAVRTDGMNRLGIGMTHSGASILWNGVFPVLRCRAYTFWQKIDYVRGMNFSQTYLWDSAATDYLIDSVPALEIPVYIFQGVHDYQTSYEEAKAYFDQLQAPEKHFYPFEDSAHSPPFEEPERFVQLLREDVLGISLP